ncbi:hypothetical protein DVH24_011813 [Malus domestica]|uniref:Protein FAR1-RELATED SEQUENCE n=1 Tax=Malus domestica TaxID=3750 RepID=A0A498JUE8_MALDO|nr:hypothetical protein DVH24_011813 [Malus domestica]
MSGLDMCKEGLLTLQFEGVTTGQRFRAEGTFVHFMRGRFPQTVLTDLDPELRDATRSELPGTKHVISIWDILPKISSWFSVSLGPRCMEFKSEFDELYRLESTEDFELQWNQTISMELTTQLTRILNEVRNMPECEGVAMDLTFSPNLKLQ